MTYITPKWSINSLNLVHSVQHNWPKNRKGKEIKQSSYCVAHFFFSKNQMLVFRKFIYISILIYDRNKNERAQTQFVEISFNKLLAFHHQPIPVPLVGLGDLWAETRPLPR